MKNNDLTCWQFDGPPTVEQVPDGDPVWVCFGTGAIAWYRASGLRTLWKELNLKAWCVAERPELPNPQPERREWWLNFSVREEAAEYPCCELIRVWNKPHQGVHVIEVLMHDPADIDELIEAARSIVVNNGESYVPHWVINKLSKALESR